MCDTVIDDNPPHTDRVLIAARRNVANEPRGPTQGQSYGRLSAANAFAAAAGDGFNKGLL